MDHWGQERVGLAAGELAYKLIQRLLPEELRTYKLDADQTFVAQEEIEELIELAQRRQFGPSTASLVAAAEDGASSTGNCHDL